LNSKEPAGESGEQRPKRYYIDDRTSPDIVTIAEGVDAEEAFALKTPPDAIGARGSVASRRG
jgi:hypothetical protein